MTDIYLRIYIFNFFLGFGEIEYVGFVISARPKWLSSGQGFWMFVCWTWQQLVGQQVQEQDEGMEQEFEQEFEKESKQEVQQN